MTRVRIIYENNSFLGQLLNNNNQKENGKCLICSDGIIEVDAFLGVIQI